MVAPQYGGTWLCSGNRVPDRVIITFRKLDIETEGIEERDSLPSISMLVYMQTNIEIEGRESLPSISVVVTELETKCFCSDFSFYKTKSCLYIFCYRFLRKSKFLLLVERKRMPETCYDAKVKIEQGKRNFRKKKLRKIQ